MIRIRTAPMIRTPVIRLSPARTPTASSASCSSPHSLDRDRRSLSKPNPQTGGLKE